MARGKSQVSEQLLRISHSVLQHERDSVTPARFLAVGPASGRVTVGPNPACDPPDDDDQPSSTNTQKIHFTVWVPLNHTEPSS